MSLYAVFEQDELSTVKALEESEMLPQSYTELLSDGDGELHIQFYDNTNRGVPDDPPVTGAIDYACEVSYSPIDPERDPVTMTTSGQLRRDEDADAYSIVDDILGGSV
jgi:hypothetical protein